MATITDRNFGYLIAYLVPGFTTLLGVSHFSDTVGVWLSGTTVDGPTVGGFLYVTLAAVAAGLTVSTVRWALIDTLHHKTGIPHPNWELRRLEKQINAFSLIVEHQYRYYQFYSNMVVALTFVLVARRVYLGLTAVEWADGAVVILAVVFFAGSRDTLAKYYKRGEMIFEERRRSQSTVEEGDQPIPARSKNSASETP